jgi:predicted acylesterase/phospholipase RssA
MYSVALQGGAMRSVYCLGAIRALAELGLARKVNTVHASSAGCVSAAVLAGQIAMDDAPSVSDAVRALLERLVGKRFIDQHRYSKIVDVDYLVAVIREVTNVSAESLRNKGIVFEVALTNAVTAAPHYVDIAQCESDQELYEALRATMAIPVLYHRRVTIGKEQFVDGGIADPLPLLRALSGKPKAVSAISSVARGQLARVLTGRDARFVQIAPGISPVLRRLMLTRNPLACSTDSIMERGVFCDIPVIRVTPSRPELLGSRVDTDETHLLTLEELGYFDGLKALAALSADGGRSADVAPQRSI